LLSAAKKKPWMPACAGMTLEEQSARCLEPLILDRLLGFTQSATAVIGEI
jgi:hypothetical protein